MENPYTENFAMSARLLKTLGHPVRLALLAELVEGPKCVTDIRDLLNVRQPNISQHLSILRDAKIVNCHERGNLRCYYLVEPELVRDLLGIVDRGYPEREKDVEPDIEINQPSQ